MIDVFDEIQKICEEFLFYMSGNENFKKNYSIAYNNILTGTYFHANCDFLLDIKHLPDVDNTSMNPVVMNTEEQPLHWTVQSKPIVSPQTKKNTVQRRSIKTRERVSSSRARERGSSSKVQESKKTIVFE